MRTDSARRRRPDWRERTNAGRTSADAVAGYAGTDGVTRVQSRERRVRRE